MIKLYENMHVHVDEYTFRDETEWSEALLDSKSRITLWQRKIPGCGTQTSEGHHPERHPEGVHGPKHVHLSSWAFNAYNWRYIRVYGQEHA